MKLDRWQAAAAHLPTPDDWPATVTITVTGPAEHVHAFLRSAEQLIKNAEPHMILTELKVSR